MDSFCGTVRDLQRAIWTSPPEPNADKMKPWASTVLGTTSKSLANAVKRLGELGPSPVDGGDRVVKHLSDKYSDLKDEVDTVKIEVDALPEGSTANEVGAVISSVMPRIAATNGKPFEGTEFTPAMRAAGRSSICFTIAGWPR